jgi:aminoglycoside phosphotransferase (APT) family kinase protein
MDTRPFLSLNLCTSAWLEAALPVLIAAESSVDLGGSDFLHLDVRSDNLCFLEDRTILIDWNWACVGNGMFDLAFWLPSLHAEGGPAPESILPNRPEMASAVSGFWAAKAGLPPHGSTLRQAQITALKTAFPWTVRALGLPPI